MVTQGAIVEAVEKYFSDDAATSDYDGVKTQQKSQMIEKMQGFTGAIAAVNNIEHHQSLVDDNYSHSEFTFDFQMKDGSHILWHEIIKREWSQDGLVVKEEYFNAN